MLPNYTIVALKTLSSYFHRASRDAGWWEYSDEQQELAIATKFALIHSEISEAFEGYRKDKMDDHLPHRKAIEVELADTLIRIFDLAGKLDLNLGDAVNEKYEYNLSRADHKLEARRAPGGKKF